MQMSNMVAELIEGYQIILPWPCLYETISTHLTRHRKLLLYLEELIRKPGVILLDDSDYKAGAFEEVFNQNRLGYLSTSSGRLKPSNLFPEI